jgi:uncharacterized protein YecE (DUF72 family)
MAGKINIGISGWSYGDWKGVFYPSTIKSADWLTYYAQFFDTTEINSSFYHLTKAQTVTNWLDKVPDDFIFCPKVNKNVTHIKRLVATEEILEKFFSAYSIMGKRLGPVLIQLPPSLRFDAVITRQFFEVLKKTYGTYDFALEARHATWMDAKAARLLKKYNIAWVISQSGVGFPYLEQITAHHVYVRFHGPGKLYASAYTEEMLRDYAIKFAQWADKGHDLWIYFNNCYYGAAIENANTLKSMLGIKAYNNRIT